MMKGFIAWSTATTDLLTTRYSCLVWEKRKWMLLCCFEASSTPKFMGYKKLKPPRLKTCRSAVFLFSLPAYWWLLQIRVLGPCKYASIRLLKPIMISHQLSIGECQTFTSKKHESQWAKLCSTQTKGYQDKLFGFNQEPTKVLLMLPKITWADSWVAITRSQLTQHSVALKGL